MTKKPTNLLSSLPLRDTTFLELLQELPPDVLASAQAFAAFRRGRKIKTVAQLLQLVLLYCGLDYSLRHTAGTLARLGVSLSDQAVSDRLRGCAGWLRHVLKQMLPAVPAAAEPPTGDPANGRRWLLIDSSTIQAVGALSTSYRLHLAWDWLRQTIVEWLVTDARTGESVTLYQLQAGDTVMTDRGYARARDILYARRHGAELIMRCAPHNLPLIDVAAGTRLRLSEYLTRATGSVVSRQVALKADTAQQSLWLHCLRLPVEKAAQARRRKLVKARRNGMMVKQETLTYTNWLIVLTSYRPEQMTAEEIGQLYRLRWQIEIVIKQLKSVIEIDRLRTRQESPLAEVYLLGKSLYALLIAKRGGQLREAAEITWRIWKMLREELNAQINQVDKWKKQYLAEALWQMKERKRRRKRQMEIAEGLINKVLSTA